MYHRMKWTWIWKKILKIYKLYVAIKTFFKNEARVPSQTIPNKMARTCGTNIPRTLTVTGVLLMPTEA
jgi:hypothetical protein